MPNDASVAGELAARRKETGFSRERVAHGLGVSAKTIERWEKTGNIGQAELRQIREFYNKPANWLAGLDNDVPRGTLEQSTRLPAELLDLARRFEIEMTRLGATDDELDHINSTLRSEHVATLVTGWDSTEERYAEFRLQLRALLRWTLMRMEFFDRKPLRPLAEIEEFVDPAAKAPATLFKPAASRRGQKQQGEG